VQGEELVENNRVYTAAVVMWLWITQRLRGRGSMQTSVLELLAGLPARFWPRRCKRLQDWQWDAGCKVSSYTGAYNKARQESLSVVKQSGDRVSALFFGPQCQSKNCAPEYYIPKKSCDKEIILIMSSMMQQMHLSEPRKYGRQAFLFVKLNVQLMV